MAPLATDPQQLLVVLNPNRRRVLLTLVHDIVAHMKVTLILEPNDCTKYEKWDDSTTSYNSDNESVTSSQTSRQIPPSPLPGCPANGLIAIREAAHIQFDEWNHEFLEKLRELINQPDEPKHQVERRNRSERLAAAKAQRRTNPATGSRFAADAAALKELYQAFPSSLNTASVEDRKEILSSLLLLQLTGGSYSAHSSVLMRYLTSSLDLPLSVLATEEKEVAESLIKASSEQRTMSADEEAQRRRKHNKTDRIWKVGLASVAGAAVIGITGGLAAPVVAGALGGLMGTVGLGGVASFLGVFWLNGALVGTLFGAFGAQMTGRMMDKYAKEVQDFKFLPLHDESVDEKASRRLRVTIGINGWLESEDDVTKPWKCLSDDTEAFALRYEMKSLISLGTALKGLVASYAWKAVKVEILKRTVLASLWAALWPAYMLGMATNIDNPFNLARNRSDKAGQVLADALINKVQGERPVTLVGYSLGARVIYSCLKSLAERRAFGLIDTVVLIGAPTPSDRPDWLTIKSTVSGNIHNVYSENDLILGFMYRTASLQLGVAGLQDIKDIKGVVNMDLTKSVSGHLRYPRIVNKILTRCGFINIKGGEGPIEQDEELITVLETEQDDSLPVDDEKPPPPPPRPKASIGPDDAAEQPKPHSDTDCGPPDPKPNVDLSKLDNDAERPPLPTRPSLQTQQEQQLQKPQQHFSLQKEKGSTGPKNLISGISGLLSKNAKFGNKIRPNSFLLRSQTTRAERSVDMQVQEEERPPALPRRPIVDNSMPSSPQLQRSTTAPVYPSSTRSSVSGDLPPGSPIHPFLRNSPRGSFSSTRVSHPSPFGSNFPATKSAHEDSDDEDRGGGIIMINNDK
ncbi:putative membrane protein C6F6.13c [Ceratocystis fimbriata CBS 114723]|uniref:Putative membrane protein C6F6.13c n=1 Tax=Ceratocystis fimbriata CBS 114723 TaxID=1035309 RepID=A0A2C5WXK3_9PEZI|nr:putative membrane protein C6F6.13c [Ceratocystis fimbriata CBS 114723]